MNESVQARRAIEILIRFVCGVIGVALLGLVTVLLYKVIERSETTHPIIIVTLAIMAPLGCLFAVISYRLLLNRGAKIGGGLFSPTAWTVAGIIFAGLAVVLTIGALWQQKWEVLIAPVPAVIFAKWCFSIARPKE
ncbi:MAG: hypothetical protein HYV01_18145 [Deltaproteobacteria bacterium]|nr:hypothetical protein [Deltaproteobacteria bacterium]